MSGSWFFDGNFNGVSDEFFDDALKLFDFPLEDVESNDAGEDWDAKFQHLVPPPSSNLLAGFTYGENSTDLKIEKSCPILCNESSSQPKQWPRTGESSSSRTNSIPLYYDSSERKYSQPFITSSSPVSVLESSSSSSSAENPTLFHPKSKIPTKRPRTKRPRPKSRTFPFITPLAYPSESRPEPYPDDSMWGPVKKRNPVHPSISDQETKKPGETRKCSHCEVTKTPQWREGPMGPKTLCNACGVRYRSGRLFPEYRPAASPTFVPAMHSNSHRKVVEMRRTGGRLSDGYAPVTFVSEYSF